MRGLLAALVFVCASSFSVAGWAESVGPTPFVSVQSTGVPSAFRQAATLRGTIGDDGVQVTIRPKVPADEGFEGEYFFFGQSLKILIAGDIDGELFQLEESQDGTHISGEWDGIVSGDKVTGTWVSADGSVTKPFALQIMPPPDAAASRKPNLKH